QMPDMYHTPLRQIPYDLAGTDAWSAPLRGVASAPGILPAVEYWDLLRPHAATLDLWRTPYMHALPGENPVGGWAAGSGPRVFLDALPEERRDAFRRAYSEVAKTHYPQRPDGTTLLPFHRLFIVARKA